MLWVVAELEVTSASGFGDRSGGLPSSGGELRAAVGERRRRGRGSGFYWRAGCGVQGRGAGRAEVIWLPSIRARAHWRLVVHGHAIGGDWRRKAPGKKGNTGMKKGKGNKGADRWATRAVSEGRTDGACGRRPKQSGPPSWAARACGEAGRRRAGLGWCGAAGARQAERSGPPSRPTREGGRN